MPNEMPNDWKSRLAQPRAVRMTLALSIVALLALQVWRPFYFLTDDNLCGWMPVVADVGRALASGESPIVSPYLNNGTQNLLRDPASLCLWNPLLLALSLLGTTRAAVLLPDLYASLNLLLCAFAMAHLGCRLREMRRGKIGNKDAHLASDGRIVLLSLSFTFSAYALITGASWAVFAANQAALPILFLGLLHADRRGGILLVGGAVLHALLGGHLSPFVFAILFVSLFAASHALFSRSREFLLRWLAGLALALALASPLLVLAARGFLASSRSGSQAEAFTSYLSIPLPVFVASFFGGKLSMLFETEAPGAITAAIPSNLAHIVSCLGAFAVFHSWGAKEKMGALEKAALGVALVSIVFIVRPSWLSHVLGAVPILRSLRIPMREVVIFLFFIHVWILARPVAPEKRLRHASLAVGAALFVASLWSMGPPSFSEMELDRRLVLSGQAARFWDGLRPQLKGKRYIVAFEVPLEVANENLDRVPWSLLGAYNYAALFRAPARLGYKIPGLVAEQPGEEPLPVVMGVFQIKPARRLQKRHPEIVILSMASLDPPRIDWIERGRRRTLPLPPMPLGFGPLKKPKSD